MTLKRLMSLPYAQDAGLALVVLAVHLPVMFLGQPKLSVFSWQVFANVVAAGSLVLRRHHPMVVLAVTLGVAIALDNLGGPDTAAVIPILIALYTTSTRLRTCWAVVITVVVIVLCTLAPPPPVVNAAVLSSVRNWIAMFVMSVAIGQLQRRGRHRSEQLAEAHRRLAEDAVVLERNRIARELHDIVAHGLSVIALRAGVARVLLPTDPDVVAEAVGVIEETSREALVEMRTLLGVLRSPDDDAGESPRPGLGRIPELIARARESGLDLEVERDGETPDLPPGQALVAYRLVQEALTNVLKHAGPVRTKVTFRCLPDRLLMEVFNETPARSAPPTVRSGHGLIGMRERVGMYGGTVTAQPVEGGFRVTAELPVEAR